MLGYYLGDGSSDRGEITCHIDDQPSLKKQAELAGMKVRSEHHVKDNQSGLMFDYSSNQAEGLLGDRVWFEFNRFREQLRSLGILSARRKSPKIIPEIYLRASRQDRISLLQGLLDSDGTISKSGRAISFTQKSKRVVEGFCELIASLGIKFSCKEKFNTSGDDSGKRYPSYLIQFYCCREFLECFRLPRKLRRQLSEAKNTMSARSRSVHIKSIKTIEPTEGNCLSLIHI